jgi:hypothetical protein
LQNTCHLWKTFHWTLLEILYPLTYKSSHHSNELSHKISRLVSWFGFIHHERKNVDQCDFLDETTLFTINRTTNDRVRRNLSNDISCINNICVDVIDRSIRITVACT